MKECFELLVLLGIAVASNILCGLYLSIGVNQIKFDKVRLINGIVKAICVQLAFIGLSYIIYKVPSLSEAIGVEPKTMMISAITVYVSKSAKTILSIFGVEKIKKEEIAEEVKRSVQEKLEEEYVDM